MYTLTVEKRDGIAKAKKLRRMGIIPGSISGRGLSDSILIQLSASDAKKLLKEKSKGAQLMLNCGSESYRVMLKEITRAPIDGQLLDLSFQILTDGETVTGMAQVVFANADKITVPVYKLVSEIPYTSLVENIVETAVIDLSALRGGDRVKVSDLAMAGNPDIQLLIPTDTIVISIEGHK